MIPPTHTGNTIAKEFPVLVTAAAEGDPLTTKIFQLFLPAVPDKLTIKYHFTSTSTNAHMLTYPRLCLSLPVFLLMFPSSNFNISRDRAFSLKRQTDKENKPQRNFYIAL